MCWGGVDLSDAKGGAQLLELVELRLVIGDEGVGNAELITDVFLDELGGVLLRDSREGLRLHPLGVLVYGDHCEPGLRPRRGKWPYDVDSSFHKGPGTRHRGELFERSF